VGHDITAASYGLDGFAFVSPTVGPYTITGKGAFRDVQPGSGKEYSRISKDFGGSMKIHNRVGVRQRRMKKFDTVLDNMRFSRIMLRLVSKIHS
jgi:hypothetical protein